MTRPFSHQHSKKNKIKNKQKLNFLYDQFGLNAYKILFTSSCRFFKRSNKSSTQNNNKNKKKKKRACPKKNKLFLKRLIKKKKANLKQNKKK